MEKEKNKLINGTTQLQEELFKVQEAWKNESANFIEQYGIKITKLETQKESLSQVISFSLKKKSNFHFFLKALMLKEKEGCELRLNYNSLFENYKKSLISMKTFKEKLGKKDSEINELINENIKLKVRAATAWEELTPRPSFRQVIFLIYFIK